jgi:hypothetical protein
MAARDVTDDNGKVQFRITRIVWKSFITRGPVTNRAVRSLVGQDERGTYRAGVRFGPDKETGEGAKMLWAPETFKSRDAAIYVPREEAMYFLEGEARQFADKAQDVAPGERIVKVEMHNWSAEIRAAERPPGAEARKILDKVGSRKAPKPERFPSKGRKIDWPPR